MIAANDTKIPRPPCNNSNPVNFNSLEDSTRPNGGLGVQRFMACYLLIRPARPAPRALFTLRSNTGQRDNRIKSVLSSEGRALGGLDLVGGLQGHLGGGGHCAAGHNGANGRGTRFHLSLAGCASGVIGRDGQPDD